MYKFCFFVPESHLESVKAAVFAAGAGRLGNYDMCSWQTKGDGQFRPLTESSPFVGQIGELEHLIEYKVETVCADEFIAAAVAAMKAAHPYEEPAYDVFKLVDF